MGDDNGQDPGLPNQSIWDIPFEDLDFKEKIGKGSFGSVYKGTYLGVDVAIKKIEKADDPEYLKYIDREVSMLQSIRHPFIVQFSGICVHSSGLYIVTEFVSGGDVRKLIKANPNLEWRKKLRISIDLAKAMLFLHSKRIIHRDLKSKNILLDEHGRIRLCDFGFARMAETKRSRHMTMCGTEGWVAPEILMGMSYDTSCDVFSFGVVVAELITGKKPGVDLWVRTPDNCYDINGDELRTKAVSGCPPRLLDLCIECCHYEPLLRPRFEEVLQQLIAIDRELPNEDTKPQTKTSNNNNNSNNLVSRQDQAHPKLPSQQQPQQHNNNEHTPMYTSTSPSQPTSSIWKTGKTSREGAPTKSGGPSKIGSQVGGNPRASADASQAAVNTHLMKMVERATTDYYYDASYINDLLLSYRCFTTPQKLFDLLVQRYNGVPADYLPPAEVEAWQKSHKIIQLRVIIFFKRWLDNFWVDFDEEGMEERLTVFDRILLTQANTNNTSALSKSLPMNGSNSHGSNGNSTQEEGVQFVSLLQKKRTSDANNRDVLSGAQSPPLSPTSKERTESVWRPTFDVNDILDVPALEVARQITAITANYYVSIQPREYLQYCFGRSGEHAPCWVGGKDEELAPNIQTFYRWSRDLTHMVATDIVKRNDKQKRAQIIERYIEVAERCAALKNFDSVFAIVDGIRHPSIDRLSETLKAVSTKSLQALETLKDLVRKENDFKAYRQALNEAAPPCIPCLDQVLQEIWFLECSSAKVLNGGIVNFFHYRQISRKISQFKQCLVTADIYAIKSVPVVQKLFLRNPEDVYNDEDLRKYSLMREEPSFV